MDGSGIVERFSQAVEAFGVRVEAIGDDQWGLPTPDVEWDVRALVNHLVSEERWAVPLLAGRTIAEVGDVFDGDLLGDDPVSAWRAAATEAVAASTEPDVVGRTVHLSFGDFSAADYLGQLISDHVIHGWDLARAIGADESIDIGLVEFVFAFLEPQAEAWRSAGAFGPKVTVLDGADRLTRLLGLTGRSK